jgi:hypothetical protein
MGLSGYMVAVEDRSVSVFPSTTSAGNPPLPPTNAMAKSYRQLTESSIIGSYRCSP